MLPSPMDIRWPLRAVSIFGTLESLLTPPDLAGSTPCSSNLGCEGPRLFRVGMALAMLIFSSDIDRFF